MLTDVLEWCGLLWCFYQLFGLSFWRHPFTAEHPLVRKWWNVTFLQTWWRNKFIYILGGLRVTIFSENIDVTLNCETILQSFIIGSKHIQMLLIVESHETGFLLRCAHPEHVYCYLPRSMSMTLISLQLAHNVICSMVCRPHAGSLVDAIILSIYH